MPDNWKNLNERYRQEHEDRQGMRRCLGSIGTFYAGAAVVWFLIKVLERWMR
jgi:hypothetical protein